MHAAHDRAFVVAGAMKADLLDDLRRAVDRAIQRNRRAGLIQFTAGRKGGWSPVAP